MAAQALGRLVAALKPGARGEQLACAHLAARGFAILERNFRTRFGEIDIVARDGPVTVFVEVKERSGATHGGGLDAVTPAKRRRVVLAARLYAMRHGLSETPLRFDVVTIDGDPTQRPAVHHCPGAFDVTGR